MKERELIELIKESNFKELKKLLKPLGNKYVKNLLEPFTKENEYNVHYLKLIKNQINIYAASRFINSFNKKQSELYTEHLKGNYEYDEKNWNKNIYKFDLLLPTDIILYIETALLSCKGNDVELYNFLINNRNGIYCVIFKIYKFWFSKKHQNEIELKKLYDNNFDLNSYFVRISKFEFNKYSDNYVKILNFLEKSGLIITDHFYRKVSFNTERNTFKQGVCKGYRINENYINNSKDKNNSFFIVRINNKKTVINLYDDFILQKENINVSNDHEEYFSDEENLFYLKNYNNRPKRIGISDDCKKLISTYEEKLIVTDLNDVFDFVDDNYDSLVQSGIQRNKSNIIEKIYDYINFFDLRYKKKSGNRFDNFNYFLDRTGRFYTFFNHCPKEIINVLFKIKSVSGKIENLIEIDMRSCHLNMLALLFNKNVLKNQSIKSFVGPELLEWFEKKLDFIPTEQLNAFKNLCSSPDYYQKITDLINERSDKKFDIDHIKQLNMYFLYGDNIFNPISNIFKLYFPFVIEFFNEVRKNFTSQSKLSYLLMRLESYFFIDKGIKSLLNERITVLPRHDCYYVAESDANKVRKILTNIYIELTEGDVNYIPSYDRETSRIKSLFVKNTNQAISTRSIQLKKYFSNTREQKAKDNLYMNIYYQKFNEFLLTVGIRNMKTDRKINIQKLTKIFDRLIKLNISEENVKVFENFLVTFQEKSYEQFVYSVYDKNYIKLIILEYLDLDIHDKTIDQPIYLSKQKISNYKIMTPYEFFLQKNNHKGLKDRQIQQNFLLY